MLLLRPSRILFVAALPVAAQVPTRTLPKPDAEFADPFSGIVAMLELPGGRVIVADNRDNALVLLDFSSGTRARIGREGSGPLEWLRPSRMLRMPGDTAYVFDAGNSRFLVVSPEGRPVRTFSPVAGAASQRAATDDDLRGRGSGLGRGGSGTPGAGGATVLNAQHTDARGRMYFAGFPVTRTDRGLAASDSFPLLRQTLGAAHADTIAFLRNPPGASSLSGDAQRMTYRVNANRPFEHGDGWTVFPDGRVFIVRTSDYHFEIVTAAGVTRTAAIPYTRVRVTEADKREWRESRAGATLTTTSGQTVPVGGLLPESWPEFKSPIAANSVFAAPSGDAWVLRQRASGDRMAVVDVLDRRGMLVGRVSFPPDVRPLAFGKTHVYAIRTDGDGLQYLQRYLLPDAK